jgi:hypothetical protein
MRGMRRTLAGRGGGGEEEDIKREEVKKTNKGISLLECKTV